MTKEEVHRALVCSSLLPEPGPEVVAQLITEIFRLRATLESILAIEHKTDGGDWDEIDDARAIATLALS